MQSGYYWSSTSYAVSTSNAWIVYMVGGNVFAVGKSVNRYVWPVRSGQVGDLANLVISKSGTGSGSVTSADGKLGCGSSCTAAYTPSSTTSVTLTAKADADSTFTGWSGDCTGTDSTCTVSMSASRNVAATFDLPCSSYTINPQSKTFPSKGGTDSLNVSANSGCKWTASSDVAWITITADSGSGNGSIKYSVASNTTTSKRTGKITVAGQTLAITQEASTGSAGKAPYDFDGDGRSDVLWRNATTGDVAIWLMKDTSIAGKDFVFKGVSLDWDIKAAGDFNGDGKADILWQNTKTGVVYIWLVKGTTIEAGGTVVEDMPADWKFVTLGDFNGDEKADIMWRSAGTGDIYVWFMDGTARKEDMDGEYIFKNMPSEWVVTAVADLNGDANGDVLWQNTTTGDVAAWLMSGTTMSDKSYVAMSIPGNWQIKVVGDLDGDGKADILWQDAKSGDVYSWLLDGFKIVGQDYAARGIPGNWQIRTSGDYNGNGKTDILWQDTTKGAVYIWLMDALKIAGEGFAAKELAGDWQPK
ncbi:FG-GAP repeat-containing protein [Candidatus Magnetobacterium bavaricum]|uniref:FG-GAP repeat-containing protein n=1 Tax=Candidatus Magnetobacterium bavaricum TaxID=29290 RepID=A0A0F3GXL3_9BACT|nr:FG-GAP repeat-containing protein [Candidatus Magnetobacterium bavaricum]